MMREIVRKSQFKKDYKRLRSSGRDISILIAVISKLQKGEQLPLSLRDHSLVGNWQSCRECHLAGDWLLIYQLVENQLILVRTGSHSELF
jgi:mRNA interferase YafQ